MKFSFKTKLFVSFLTYGLILLFFSQFIVFKVTENQLKENTINNATLQYEHTNDMFVHYIEQMKMRLNSVKNSSIFNKNFQYGKRSVDIDSLFLDIAYTSNNIMQLRYIDNEGKECIRVDRDSANSTPYLVKETNLQNKSGRYYFKESLNLNNGEFWYSKLDLNRERGKIEKPIKPVLRIATPLFFNGKKIGIMIVNIFMDDFLKSLVHVPNYNIFLIDKDGYIIISPKHQDCWCKYLAHKDVKDHSNYDTFDGDNKNILSNNEFIGEHLYSNRLSLKNSENIKIVVQPKTSYVDSKISNNLTTFLMIFIGMIFISFPVSYYFSIPATKLKEQVDSEKKEQAILLSLFDISDAVLIKWKNDDNWSVEYASKSINTLLGYENDFFINGDISYERCAHPEDIPKIKQEHNDAVDRGDYFFTHTPYRVITKENKIKWVLDSTIVVRDDKGDIINFVGYLTDITKIKNNELKLKKLSITDQLTKIYNRVFIDEELKKQLYRFNRNDEECSLILIDIDFFKSVNDDYGHLVGDSVLKEFANILQIYVRDSDLTGRWGGEEFLIILPHTNIDQAMQLAEILRKKIETFEFSNVGYKTASFGVSTLIKDKNIEYALELADKALYYSKENGRNKVTKA